jgi:hypothetical protein
MSGDDMNFIQVGRRAVSRYHQTRKFFMTDEGFNYDLHVFRSPSAELGMKLGGFMMLSASETILEEHSDGDHDTTADVDASVDVDMLDAREEVDICT